MKNDKAHPGSVVTSLNGLNNEDSKYSLIGQNASLIKDSNAFWLAHSYKPIKLSPQETDHLLKGIRQLNEHADDSEI